MIFQHTWEKVLSGQKTQTRRLVKSDEDYSETSLAVFGLALIPNAATYSDVVRYQVGKTYSVQPARGQKAVGRIKLLNIRKEDVRNISEDDVAAEGFTSFADFMRVWCKMHDPSPDIAGQFYSSMSNQTFISLTTRLGRPAGRYQAWVLDFEVVQQ